MKGNERQSLEGMREIRAHTQYEGWGAFGSQGFRGGE